MLFYSYGNIIRILDERIPFETSLMVDVNLDDKTILSVFDASKPFDAAFIKSYQNLLRESTPGFRLLSDNEADTTLKALAANILGLNASFHPRIPSLLSSLGF